MYRSRHNSIYAYVAWEFVLSFAVAFLFFFFIFFVNQILLLAEDILTKDISVLAVVKLILFSLPSIVALSFPFGSLVGALMTVGRFASSNEIIAFQASGVPLTRLFVPMAVLGVLFSGASFVMNDYFLPLGTINFGRLYRELLYSNPNLELEPHSVIPYQDSVIVTGGVRDGRIGDMVIIEKDDRNARRIITSRDASLSREEGGASVLSLSLNNVFSHSVEEGQSREYSYFTSESMIYNVLLRDITFSLRSPGPREMSSKDVYEIMQEKRAALEKRKAEHKDSIARLQYGLYAQYMSLALDERASDIPEATRRANLRELSNGLALEQARAITDRSLQIYAIEFYKKFSIPFACLTFVIFAFPVGLFTRRSGRSVGFAIGLLVAVIYWSLLIGGQSFGMQRQNFSPFLSMWIPNFVVLAAAVPFFIKRLRR